jgi:DNA-binding IclR family transcriptional regulator
VVQIDMRESNEGIKIGTYIGKITKPTYGILGKVFLSYVSREKAKSLVEKYPPLKWEMKTDYTWDDVCKSLEGIQRKQYTISENEVFDGISGVATPIFNRKNRCIAVASILVPSFNFNAGEKERCLRLCKQFSGYVSKDMGYLPQIYQK